MLRTWIRTIKCCLLLTVPGLSRRHWGIFLVQHRHFAEIVGFLLFSWCFLKIRSVCSIYAMARTVKPAPVHFTGFLHLYNNTAGGHKSPYLLPRKSARWRGYLDLKGDIWEKLFYYFIPSSVQKYTAPGNWSYSCSNPSSFTLHLSLPQGPGITTSWWCLFHFPVAMLRRCCFVAPATP